MTAEPSGRSPHSAASPPRRCLALWLPFLPADRIAQERANSDAPDERPLAIVGKARGALRIEAVDRRAAALGLGPGLTLADARARAPELAAVASNPGADARLLGELARFCGRMTPLVALDAPDGLILDITGCDHLFGGESALRERATAALARLGVEARAAIADGPDAARALARFSRAKVVPSGAAEPIVRALPIAALGLPAETALALARAGLKRIGQLADLPHAALSARFGKETRLALDRLLGREERRIAPLRPPPEIAADLRFPAPLLEAGALMEGLGRLLRDAGRQLEDRGQGGRVFEACFFRTDGAARLIRIETGRPQRDPAIVLRLFRERLDAIADPIDPGFGFDAMRLEVPTTEPFETEEPDFDRRAVGEAELAGLVDRLAARFGRDRVQRFEPSDTHDPLRAARRVSALGRAPVLPFEEQTPGEPPLRPLQTFDPPQAIEVLAEVPDGHPLRFRWRRVLHEVARAEGPERIAPEWWRRDREGAPRREREDAPRREREDAPRERDYYRIEDAAGRRFWVFRLGLYGGGDGEAPRWFLHGLFA